MHKLTKEFIMDDVTELTCRCGQKYYRDPELHLEKWEYDYCSYACFHKHMKPQIKRLAKKHKLTIDQLKELYYDCDDLNIKEWFPIERYNPDKNYKREQPITMTGSGMKIGHVFKLKPREW